MIMERNDAGLRGFKRRVISEEECKHDLQAELVKMFEAFGRAVAQYQKEVVLTPPISRARAFEASLLNSKMIQAIQESFPKNWKFGKYKRFLLRVQGYNVFFKKLNGKDMPMNIKTLHSTAIYNQLQTSLFDNYELSAEPILFFGYKKDKFGTIHDPKLVYVDEEAVKWTLTEDKAATTKVVNIAKQGAVKAEPKLKEGLKETKRTSNSKDEQ
jgi:hypothetical protein